MTDRLWDLYQRYYGCVDRLTFERDQAEKDWVLTLSDPDGTIRGFTTLKLYDRTVAGRRVRAIFNGNTIIDREYWGEQELVRTWCRFMARLKHSEPDVPLYWYLIVSGYRTYLYLPLFYKSFFPCHDRATPPFEQALIDTLGAMKFRDEFRDGIVHVAAPREVLRPELAVPPPSKLENPHVRFFVDRNPGYVRGDELVCMVEYSLENTMRFAHEALVEASGVHVSVA